GSSPSRHPVAGVPNEGEDLTRTSAGTKSRGGADGDQGRLPAGGARGTPREGRACARTCRIDSHLLVHIGGQGREDHRNRRVRGNRTEHCRLGTDRGHIGQTITPSATTIATTSSTTAAPQTMRPATHRLDQEPDHEPGNTSPTE